MTPEEKIGILNGELQVLAFNLADVLDTLNFHSGREAVRDLNRNAFGIVEEMREKIRSLLYNLHQSGREDELEDAGKMDALLEVVHNCGGQPENYRAFVDKLIPLLELLNRWGERGPAPGV